jgi:hypothetical protein
MGKIFPSKMFQELSYHTGYKDRRIVTKMGVSKPKHFLWMDFPSTTVLR